MVGGGGGGGGEGKNVSRTLENRISLPSVSTILSPVVCLGSTLL